MSPRTVHGFEQAGGEVEMAAVAPITVQETSKGEFRVELKVDPNTLKINDNEALEAKVIGAEATTPLTVTTANDIRTFTLNFDNNSLVVKDNALRLAGKHIIHAAPTSGLFMVPDATTGEMYLNYKTDNDTVARDSILGELHLRRVPVKDKGGLTQTEVLYTPIPGDPGTPGIKWYELSLNADEITTFLDPRNGVLHAEPALLTNSGIRKEDLLNNMRSIGLSVDNLTAIIEPRPNNPDGSAHPGLLRSIPVVVPNAGLEVQNFSETETYPKRLAVLVDGSTVVLTNGKVTGNYTGTLPALPTDPHVTVTGNELGLTNVPSQAAMAAVEYELMRLEVGHTGLPEVPLHPVYVTMDAAHALIEGQLASKQASHPNLTNLSSDPPFLDKIFRLTRPDTNTAAFSGTVFQQYAVGGSQRWQLCTTGATGTNTGSDLTWTALADNGNWWYDAFQLRRSDGMARAFKGLVVGNGEHDTANSRSTLQVHGAMATPSSFAGAGMYHRSAVGLGLFSDFGASLQVNGATAPVEAWRTSNAGVTDFKFRPSLNGKILRAQGESIMTDGLANGNTQVHHELRAGDDVRWSWIVRGGGTAGTAGAQYLALRRHGDDELPATPEAEAFAVDRYTGITDFKFNPTVNGTRLATVGDVSASAFSTFPNNTWINSAEGSPRLYFQNGAETILRAANSTFYFRTSDNVANLLSLTKDFAYFGTGSASAGARMFGVEDTNPNAYCGFLMHSNAGWCNLFLNGTTRTADGGAAAATLRNDAGTLLLQAKGSKGISIAADTGNATFDGLRTILGGTSAAYRHLEVVNPNAASYTLLALLADQAAGCDLMLNGSTRSADGGPNTTTLRANPGTLRLHAKGGKGLSIAADTGQTKCDAAIITNAGSGGSFHYVMQNAAVNRWAIGLTGTESGTDTGSDFALWCNKNDGSAGTVYSPFSIRRTDGVTNFAARPTFNGNALALLSEVTGGGGTFTTFNNDAWINSADGKNRLWFSANDWTILNSPTSMGFRTGNASAGPDKMVLDGNGCLSQAVAGTGITLPLSAMQAGLAAGQFNALQFGKAGSTNNAARVTYTHTADGSANNTVSLGLWGSPALSVDGTGVAKASEFVVGNSQLANAAAAGNYFLDSGAGDAIVRANNSKALLLGTSPSRNADLRIEADGTVNFRAKPRTGGVDLATTTELTNQRTTLLDTDGPKRFGCAYTRIAYDVDTLTTDGTAVWSYPLTFKTKNLRSYSHLVFHIELSAYVASMQTGTMVADILYTPPGMQNQYTETIGVRRGAGGSTTYGGHLSLTFFTATLPAWESGFDVAGNSNVVFRLTLGGWRTNAGNRFNLTMKEEPTIIAV